VSRTSAWLGASLFASSVSASVANAEELVVWHTWRGAEEQALTEAVARFDGARGHRTTLVPVPFGAFANKLETAVPRGNGPDVFLAGHDNLGKWVAMGIPAAVAPPEEPHRPAALAALTLDQTLYGAPLATKSILLLYDPTRVASPPQTWGELEAVAVEQTGDGHWGLAWQAAEPYYFAPWLLAAGGTPLGQAGDPVDPDALARGLRALRHLAVDLDIAPSQATAELIGRLYDEGNATFVLSGPWFVADRTRPIAAAPLPAWTPNGEPSTPWLTVDAAFVSATSQHPGPAADLAAYLAGPPGAEVRARVGKQAVTLRSQTLDDPLQRALAEQAERAVPMPSHPDLGTWFEAQARAIRATLRGSATPEEAAVAAGRWFRVLSRPAPAPAEVGPWVVVGGIGALALAAWAARLLLRERAALRAKAWDYLWILPAAGPLAVLVLAPFLVGAAVSLFVHHQGTWTFVGLSNFITLLTSPDFPITAPMSFPYTLAVTLLWTATNLAAHVGLGVGVALLLREPWVRLRPLWRALLVLPWAIPNYITALVWKAMFHAQYGAINQLVGRMTGAPIELDWFGSFATAFSANLITNTWLGFPFMMVTALGALQAVPRELEEAAALDGASWTARFRHVVWPLLAPAMVPAILMGSVWTFNMFNVVFLVSGGEPDGATEILVSDAWRWAFSRGNRYGYASAYAVLIFGVLLVWSRTANRLAGRRVL
jgi:arabinogalactan oligomer/maltooligosaccharide transport system permease protein